MMHGRYEVEDLLKLRASPLICKPPNLPPIEEWMGPAEPANKRPTARGKPDDLGTTVEGFQKRPSLLDAQGRRSTTDPDRMTFGPPKHSFSSSNITKAKLGQSKIGDDADANGTDRKSGTFGLNGKFDKLGRTNEDEEIGGRLRRDNERSRWPSKDLDRGEANSRTFGAKDKSESSWTRRDRGDAGQDPKRDALGWRARRDNREIDKNDLEPEWADAPLEPEMGKAHTHEDFLQWMESMKNKTTTDQKTYEPSDQDTFGDDADYGPPMPAAPSQAFVSDAAAVDKFFAKFDEKAAATETRSSGKTGKSRFASLFGPKDEPPPAVNPNPMAAFFQNTPATPAAPPPTELQAKSDTPDQKANADAFAKLLEMLNKNQTQSNNAGTPAPQTQTQNEAPARESEPASRLPRHAQEFIKVLNESRDVPARPPPGHERENTKPQSPIDVAELESHARPAVHSPDIATILRQGRPQQQPLPSHTPNPSLDRLLESRSPANNAQRKEPKATTEDLLNLLRRTTVNEHPEPQNVYPPNYQEPRRPPPGLSGLRQEHPMQMFADRPRDGPRSIFDDPVFSTSGRSQDSESILHRASQPANGNGAAMFSPGMNYADYLASQQARPPQSRGAAPPGMHRPPGLANPPQVPPGWPAQQRDHQQPGIPQQRPSQPPLGINPNSRNNPQIYARDPYANYPPDPRSFPSGPPRKRTMDTAPPPGFSGINIPPGFGPPPGYPTSTSPVGNAPPQQQRYGLGDVLGMPSERARQPPQQPPQPQVNPLFAAMYGNGNGSAARSNAGGVGVPPGFR